MKVRPEIFQSLKYGHSLGVLKKTTEDIIIKMIYKVDFKAILVVLDTITSF